VTAPICCYRIRVSAGRLLSDLWFMISHLRAAPLAVLLLPLFTLVGCSKSSEGDLSSDTLAVSTPAFADTALSSAPRAPAATTPRTPAAPRRSTPTTGTLAGGTGVAAVASQAICSNTHPSGTRITARTRDTMTGTNGASIPAGTEITFSVGQATVANNRGETPTLVFADDMRVFPASNPSGIQLAGGIDASVDRLRLSSGGNDAKKVVGGAAAGAIIGQIIGKNTKSTVIGAATGGAVGAVAAHQTADEAACVPAGRAMTLTLRDAVQIPIARS
jgi:hypothetical protein